MNTKKHLSEKEIALHIGKQLRDLRNLQGMTLNDLSKRIRLSYQQIQKYESATNRISAANLYTIACALHVSPLTFFEGLPELASPFTDDIELVSALMKLRKSPHSELIGNVLSLLSKQI